MYGAWDDPMISLYEWFSMTIVKVWSKAGTEPAAAAGAGACTANAARVARAPSRFSVHATTHAVVQFTEKPRSPLRPGGVAWSCSLNP